MNDTDPRRRRTVKGRTRGGGGGGRGRGGRSDKRAQVLRVLKLTVAGLLAVGALGLITLSAIFIYYGSDPKLPNIKQMSDFRPPQTTRVLDRNGVPIGAVGGPERRRVVPLEKIPKHFLNAVIASEDPSFYEHEGIDYTGIMRAVISNVTRGRIGPGRWGQGGSTITQQVVKWLTKDAEKTPRRKIQEMILARRLSKQLSKDEILAIYVNLINYGAGQHGCEEAAQHYFGKSITDVDLGEAAFLAGVPQSPENHSPYKHPQSAKNRQVYVLRQMVVHRYIDKATADAQAARPIPVRPPQQRLDLSQAPEALGVVQRVVAEKFGAENVAGLGAEVKTTIDLPLQKLARESIERGLEALDLRQGYRGPVGHIDGSKLGQYRYELKLARELGRGGDVAKAAASEAAKSKRPRRFDLRPIRDPDIFQGLVERVEKDPSAPRGGRIVVDIGGRTAAVDLSLEARYTKAPKPLTLERFRPGDLVRVRLAPERRKPGPGGKPGPEALALELGPQAAMVVMDPRSREVLALVGGYGYRPGGWDRTQRALRQAGSAFKPFVFAAAIESRRHTPASVLIDAPEVYESVGEVWKPQNYEREAFKGRVRLRTALAESLNTVAIRVANDVGLPAIIELAERAGISTPMPKDVGLSLALGANSVTPLELANAFATFPAGGQRASWRLVTAINEEEIVPSEQPVAAFKPETAYVMTSIMRSVISEGTGKGAARVGRPIAGKTGTSSEEKDAWFVGYSPDLLAAVWVGFDDSKSLGKGEAGGRTAVPIWADFMTKALADRPTRDFTPPPGVEVVRIDPASGLLPPPGAEGIEEVFLQGTAPRETAVSTDEAATADKLLFQDDPAAPAPAAPAP